MQLPVELRQAVDALLGGETVDGLARESGRLTSRYRAEVKDGRLHVDSDGAANAYLAARLPATFAAIRACLEQVAERLPTFKPASLVDLGSGPGTAMWAAHDCWPSLASAYLVEASPAMRRTGARLGAPPSTTATWHAGDILKGVPDGAMGDVASLAYVLDELPDPALDGVVERLWSRAGMLAVIIEPGTPAGWQRIVKARTKLLALGGHVVAPCSHAKPCPIAPPDWCHFSRRVARSRIHRQVKQGEAPFEDEKYAFVAASRMPAAATAPRVIAPPRVSRGVARLKLCRQDGTAGETIYSRRDGDAFRFARRCGWGDAFDLHLEDGRDEV